MLRYKDKDGYWLLSNIKVESKCGLTRAYTEIKLQELLPTYMHKIPMRIIAYNNKNDVRKAILKGCVSFFKKLIKTRNFYKCVDEELYTLPELSYELQGMTMNQKDCDGNTIIHIYMDNIYEDADNIDQNTHDYFVIILHELYHSYQEKYWKDFEKFNEDYTCSNANEESIEKYRSHIFETTARQWSLDRYNYITGEKLRYVYE